MSRKIYKHYEKSAYLYDNYIPRADYGAAAMRLRHFIHSEKRDAQSLLDVGCGSGRHIEHLKSFFRCEGIDRSQEFVEIAKTRCPEVPISQGDMTSFDLERKFDVVTCLFCAVSYVRTLKNLKMAIRNMARHVQPGGLLLVEPWVYPEKFWIGRLTTDFVDEPDIKIARMFVTKRQRNISIYDIHYLVGTENGIEYFVEREELGLFTHEQYVRAFEDAGLAVSYDPQGGLFEEHNIGIYCGRKPAG